MGLLLWKNTVKGWISPAAPLTMIKHLDWCPLLRVIYLICTSATRRLKQPTKVCFIVLNPSVISHGWFGTNWLIHLPRSDKMPLLIQVTNTFQSHHMVVPTGVQVSLQQFLLFLPLGEPLLPLFFQNIILDLYSLLILNSFIVKILYS